MTVVRAGVVGAGVMGVGLAVALGAADIDVVLVDSSPDALAAAPGAIRREARTAALVRRDDRAALVAAPDRVRCSGQVGDLVGVQVVIENITEDRRAKAALYGEMAEVIEPDVLVGANTSGIPVTWLASHLDRPERVIGMHFMNPVPLKDAVEVVRGRHTSEGTVDRAHELLLQLGKRGIVVNDAPGFVINRVLMLAINEAAQAVDEGTATAETVDDLFRACLGFPMGPLETADLIGLDTVRDSLVALRETTGHDKYTPAPILGRLVAAGRLGRKTGAGFHDSASRRR